MPSSSPQVLALQWRPHNFSEMIGQEHILPALINSLDQKRLHHAYLFTGTRGVGKTSVARILAKCLNCEVGISSKPCNTCGTCRSIDRGNFIDLIEVDAASRTKVEDTREMLDNVQYTPTQGRFKIYLIDEVHMLSGHSFNALLKTLEEPPSHVKFLLATTDPQKLPMTVLSRCLQFHLKHIPAEQISQHLALILKKENISFEVPALTLLSLAAKGSMRDGLSLLDQAIAFSNNNMSTTLIQSMLGHIGKEDIWTIIRALADNNPSALLAAVANIAEYTTDFSRLLEDLTEGLHQVAVAQFVPNETDATCLSLANLLSKELVQLYYQIALMGMKDISLASNPRAGLEMTLLRMLAFEPATGESDNRVIPLIKNQKDTSQSVSTTCLNLANNWTNILDKLQLTGMAQVLASHCSVDTYDDKEVRLLLSEKHKPILSKKLEDRIKCALSSYLGKEISLVILTGQPVKTPALAHQAQKEMALKNAEDVIERDAHVQTLVSVFDAEIQPGSTKAIETASTTK